MEVKEQQDSLEALKKEFSRLKSMLGQTQQARSKRAQNADMIVDIRSSTRYRRRQQSKDMLEYIHGGEEGAIFGAWDLIAACASKETMDKLIASYTRGVWKGYKGF